MINGKIIAIDARMIEMSGIGTYIQNLLNRGMYDYAIGNPEVISKYDKNIKVIPFDANIYGAKEQLLFPDRECKKAGINLIHFPHYNVPMSYQGKYVVTIHDLTHIVFPELMGSKLKYYYAKFLMKNAVKRSAYILTDSLNSKGDIIRFFPKEAKQIEVAYCAVSKDFSIKKSEEYEYLYKKFAINRDSRILLYVGNLKVHKNLYRLLEAFSMLDNKDKYQLILAGKAFNSLSLNKMEEKLGITENVIHTGLIDKADLIGLYNLADLFVFPSLYEGFGLPPLEAMACGTAVCCSKASSLPEVVGDAAMTFDPTNVTDIKNTIEKFFYDPLKKEELIKKGRIQVKKFSWDNTAGIVKQTMENSL